MLGAFISILMGGLFLYNLPNFYTCTKPKYIVISDRDGYLKLHSKAVLFKDALHIKQTLEEQYYNQTLSGYRVKKKVLIQKYPV